MSFPKYTHTVTLGGPQDILTFLFKTAQSKPNDAHLAPISNPGNLPVLSNHQIMNWKKNKDTMMQQMREDIKREEPFVIMDWEVQLWMAGQWPKHPSLPVPSYNQGVSTLSLLRILNALRIERNFEIFGEFDQPAHFNPQNTDLEILTLKYEPFVKSVLNKNGSYSTLHLHFETTKNILPTSVFVLEKLTKRERQNLFTLSHVFESHQNEHSGSIAFSNDGFQRLPSESNLDNLTKTINSFDFPRFVTEAHTASLDKEHPLNNCEIQKS